MKKILKKIFLFFLPPRKKESAKALFTPHQLSLLDSSCIPKHIAFIPDGNRRWAKKEGFFPDQGHIKGKNTLRDIVEAGQEIGIQTLTFYIFSTENWARPKQEIDHLMKILKMALIQEKEMLIHNDIRFSFIGDFSPLPQDVLETLQDIKQATSQCQKTEVIFAINYGSRSEICRIFQKLLDKNVSKQDITEELIAQNLDTAKWPNPDLLIRTGGERRLSNFLLWQLSYAELYYTNTPWPKFTPSHFLQAVLDFQQRERRLGGN